MKRLTLLEHERYLYLKLAGVLMVLAGLAYLLHRPAVEPYGGTWLGYVLGTAAALILVGQLWYGVRRNAFGGRGSLRDRLSAHVYLGASLVVLATLHGGFQFGWNVHTLAYALMLAAIATGAWGLLAYLRLPRLMTENMGDDSLDTLLLKIADLDELARLNALQLSDETNAIVARARRETLIGGGVFRQLSGRHPDCPTTSAVRRLGELGRKLEVGQSKIHRELYAVMHMKEVLVARARQDVAYRARLEFWLYFHIPLSIAAAAALAAHVFSVFFYR
ncbi:MAG: hypothetical protein Q8O25_07665 [Sulfurisoma sp.]|nr:hypothetical protein [Sulfurisoma sp.]